MKIPIDIWSSGYRGDIVQRPLIEAISSCSALQHRIVVSDTSPSLARMKAIGTPMFALPTCRSVGSLPRTSVRILKARTELFNWYASTKSIVHVVMASPWDQFYLDIPKQSGSRILVTIHDAVQHLGEESQFMSFLERRIVRIADHLAVLSNHAGELLRARIGNVRPIHVVSPGLVMDPNPPKPPKPLPSDGPVKFLFFGRIRDYKGLDILLDAWRITKLKNAPPMELTIAGDGDIGRYRTALEGLRDVNLIHQWISDDHMAQIFATHHVNVLPYREGSTSATSLAGMWAGMPSIATPVPTFAEQLRDGYNARICKTISSTSLSECILELSQSPQLFGQLAKGAHEQAKRLSAPAVAQNWKALYEMIWRDQY